MRRSSLRILLSSSVLLVAGGLAPGARAQGLDDVDVSGAWKIMIKGTFDDPTYLKPHFKAGDVVYLQQSGTQLAGLSLDKAGACGLVTIPATGSKAGSSVDITQVIPVILPPNCTSLGEFTLHSTGPLLDAAHASLTGDGLMDATVQGIHVVSGLVFTGTLKRISGMQSPDDPDGDGPAVPVSQIGSGEPGAGAHDLAVTRIKAPLSLHAKSLETPLETTVVVQIQNRGQHDEVIDDAAILAQLVTLEASQIGGSGALIEVALLPPAAAKFPLEIAPRKKLNVRFQVSLPGIVLESDGAGTSTTFAWTARVDHAQLPEGTADDHPFDDTAPRSVAAPYTFDSYPDGKIKEKGVGAKKPDKTFGDPVLTTVTIG